MAIKYFCTAVVALSNTYRYSSYNVRPRLVARAISSPRPARGIAGWHCRHPPLVCARSLPRADPRPVVPPRAGGCRSRPPAPFEDPVPLAVRGSIRRHSARISVTCADYGKPRTPAETSTSTPSTSGDLPCRRLPGTYKEKSGRCSDTSLWKLGSAAARIYLPRIYPMIIAAFLTLVRTVVFLHHPWLVAGAGGLRLALDPVFVVGRRLLFFPSPPPEEHGDCGKQEH